MLELKQAFNTATEKLGSCRPVQLGGCWWSSSCLLIVASCRQSTPRWHGRCSVARSVPGGTLSGLSGHNIHVLAAHTAFLWDINDGAGPKGSDAGVMSSYTGFGDDLNLM